eukprot:CAMPEP_0184310218 /NCGR_PEP_ID=MMETSP1049-20130417/26557_1 /TAXON_ID=77928 /ORGANISM="Proteomonas sulcata, Strain CCMP704" /LENGTH=47 /DNA_ID= /DNA_START= /DNA_END= /DNA_ORIENTATION=
MVKHGQKFGAHSTDEVHFTGYQELPSLAIVHKLASGFAIQGGKILPE